MGTGNFILKGFSVLLVCFTLVFGSCKSVGNKTQKTTLRDRPSQKTAVDKTITSSEVQKVIDKAISFIGTRHKLGGMDHSGIDCSGLVCVSYGEVNMKLPRTAGDQANVGKRIYIGELEVGDLVFFTDKQNGTKITHVGIVTFTDHKDSTRFVHASVSKGVREDELMDGYWRPLYLKATRILLR